jgi:hypothetical protein
MARGFIAAIATTIAVSSACAGCTFKASEPAADGDGTQGGTLVLAERFDGPLGARFSDTSGGKYAVVNGELRVQGARNRPLWLNEKLPDDARIEFKARSQSPAVDIKVELYGDGKSYAKTASYTATSYVLILGGWNNSRSIIARMNEHGDDRQVRAEPRGVVGRTYSFVAVRRGGLLTWFVDGERFLALDDAEPLRGPGHDRFAFNNWESEVYFDDLVVYRL